MTKVSPLLDQQQQKDAANNQQHSDIAQALKLFSIKTCLIFMTSMLIFMSVVILSSIWISCFSPTVSVISSQVRDAEFDRILSHIKQTMNEVTMVLETAKVQIDNQRPFHLDSTLEQLTYSLYRSEFLYFHTDLILAVYIGEPFGWEGGMLLIGKDHMYFDLIRGVGISLYPCKDIQLESCQRNNTPSTTFAYSSNVVSYTALKRPGGPVFTLSYADKTLPSITFLTLITSYTNPAGSTNNTYPYSFHFGYDMSVGSVSKYLTNFTSAISGSKAFTIEVETGYIISSDVADARVAEWSADGKESRKTALNFEDAETVEIGKMVYSAFPDLKKIPCNSGAVLSGSMRYVSVYRYCTATQIDWLIVFSVPQWNYIGTMIIAIVIAIGSGVIRRSCIRAACRT